MTKINTKQSNDLIYIYIYIFIFRDFSTHLKEFIKEFLIYIKFHY